MTDDIARLGEEYWEYQLRTGPTYALMIGDHRYDTEFEDYSRAAEDEDIAALRDFAARAEAINPATLSDDEQVSRSVLMFEASTAAAMGETRQAELAVNHAMGLQAMLPVTISQLPLTDANHATAMLTKLGGVAKAFDDKSVRLREGIEAGRTPPRLAVEKTIEQLDGYLATSQDSDPMTQFRTPPGMESQAESAWRDALAEASASLVRPAMQRHRDVLADETLPVARPEDRSGVCWLADGADLYATAIYRHTSLPFNAEEIHQIGLDTIEALGDEYRTIGKEALGTEDLNEIYAKLREDAELHFSDGPSIVAASEVAMARAKAAMGDWFGRLPKADCVVAETPTGPTAFYMRPALDGSRPGTFFVNTVDPTRWGKFEIEAMAFHEGIPGHHLQLAISQELENQPEFRKHAGITAFAEGWGLYTERLADEMGLYSGPLERIGMLSADSMRAGRLVVDTGLHALGWSREHAIDYFLENSPMSRGTIEGEVDRYIGMPGQALAYMMGRREIVRIRAEAEAELGDRFDVKGFHDIALGSGLLPLPVLDEQVRKWVATV